MKRALPWILTAIAVLAFAVTFLELNREHSRQRHHRALFREFVIRSDLAAAKAPILIIGDSITEGAKFPREIAGRTVVNGGISGATVEDFQRIAPLLLAGKPSFVVVALGTNNTAESLRASYPALLHQLRALTPNIMAVGVTPQVDAESKNAAIKAAADREGIYFFAVPMPAGSTHPDGVHLSDAGYQAYTPALAAEIADRAGRGQPKIR